MPGERDEMQGERSAVPLAGKCSATCGAFAEGAAAVKAASVTRHRPEVDTETFARSLLRANLDSVGDHFGVVGLDHDALAGAFLG